MTNPNNSIGTNGAFGGRTSVNAFNDLAAAFSGRGIISGWEMSPNSGMSIAIGGNGTERDVALAEDNIGNKTTINNVSESPVAVTIGAAPGANSRIDAVVAYVQKPPQGSDTITDNYSACGLIVVQGTAAATPVTPSEAQIRQAITADGSSGATAYYVVLGTVTVASGTTDITGDMLTAGDTAKVKQANMESPDMLFLEATGNVTVDGGTVAEVGRVRTLLNVPSGYRVRSVDTIITGANSAGQSNPVLVGYSGSLDESQWTLFVQNKFSGTLTWQWKLVGFCTKE